MKEINFIAYLGFTYFSGIGIIDIINGEAVKFAYHYYNSVDEKNCYNKPRTAMVKYNAKGDAFFISHNKRYYLRDFLKTNF